MLGLVLYISSSVLTKAFRLTENQILKEIRTIGPQDSLKILLTTKDGGKAKRAHQTFLQLQDQNNGLETAFPFQVKDNGKGKVEIVRSSALYT